MAIYTKNGDGGNSIIIGKDRISKSNPAFEVLGTIDELNSSLGIVISDSQFSEEATDFLCGIQSNLLKLGSLISNVKISGSYEWLKEELESLEDKIDGMENELPKLTKFILPGGSNEASYIHLSRSICRRLERVIVSYYEDPRVDRQDFVLMYINRLSDFLFTLARYINFKLGYEEKIWKN